MIEGVQVDAAHGDSRRINRQQFAPKFFLWRVQAHDDDRMGIHAVRFVLNSPYPNTIFHAEKFSLFQICRFFYSPGKGSRKWMTMNTKLAMVMIPASQPSNCANCRS